LVFPKLELVKINPKIVIQEDKIGGKNHPKNVKEEENYFWRNKEEDFGRQKIKV
jgi:hypothetical protein